MSNNKSPSSQRAWIEIMTSVHKVARYFVALLAEGVDRNLRHLGNYHVLRVALLAEGVDRNYLSTLAVVELMRRPPRRGRG